MALRFILNNPVVSTIIPGMRKEKHVRSNLACSDDRALPRSCTLGYACTAGTGRLPTGHNRQYLNPHPLGRFAQTLAAQRDVIPRKESRR